MPEDGTECQSFTVTSIDTLLEYENKLPASIFRQLCLLHCKQTNDVLS